MPNNHLKRDSLYREDLLHKWNFFRPQNSLNSEPRLIWPPRARQKMAVWINYPEFLFSKKFKFLYESGHLNRNRLDILSVDILSGVYCNREFGLSGFVITGFLFTLKFSLKLEIVRRNGNVSNQIFAVKL